MLGRRYRQSSPLWPTENPPEKKQLKHASTVRKAARKGARGEGGKEGDKSNERRGEGEQKEGKKVNHNRSGLVSFGVFAFSG